MTPYEQAQATGPRAISKLGPLDSTCTASWASPSPKTPRGTDTHPYFNWKLEQFCWRRTRSRQTQDQPDCCTSPPFTSHRTCPHTSHGVSTVWPVRPMAPDVWGGHEGFCC